MACKSRGNMQNITEICDKIIEMDKKCECIGLCYVQEHWFAEKEFKQYASDHAANNIETYARALLIALDVIDELDLVIIKERIEKLFEVEK